MSAEWVQYRACLKRKRQVLESELDGLQQQKQSRMGPGWTRACIDKEETEHEYARAAQHLHDAQIRQKASLKLRDSAVRRAGELEKAFRQNYAELAERMERKQLESSRLDELGSLLDRLGERGSEMWLQTSWAGLELPSDAFQIATRPAAPGPLCLYPCVLRCPVVGTIASATKAGLQVDEWEVDLESVEQDNVEVRHAPELKDAGIPRRHDCQAQEMEEVWLLANA